jgi:hypothetical protein
MAYGRSTGGKMGGKGGGGISLKSDMAAGSTFKSGQKRAFGKSGGKGIKGSQIGKDLARKAARKKV